MFTTFRQALRRRHPGAARNRRERKRRKTGGKVEGRKSYAEVNPELVALARDLAKAPEGSVRPVPLRKIAAALAARGFTTPSGRSYSASAISSMLYD
jgi:hypothetical protein